MVQAYIKVPTFLMHYYKGLWAYKIKTETHFKSPIESKSTHRRCELQLKSLPVTLFKELTSHQLCNLQ